MDWVEIVMQWTEQKKLFCCCLKNVKKKKTSVACHICLGSLVSPALVWVCVQWHSLWPSWVFTLQNQQEPLCDPVSALSDCSFPSFPIGKRGQPNSSGITLHQHLEKQCTIFCSLQNSLPSALCHKLCITSTYLPSSDFWCLCKSGQMNRWASWRRYIL